MALVAVHLLPLHYDVASEVTAAPCLTPSRRAGASPQGYHIDDSNPYLSLLKSGLFSCRASGGWQRSIALCFVRPLSFLSLVYISPFPRYISVGLCISSTISETHTGHVQCFRSHRAAFLLS